MATLVDFTVRGPAFDVTLDILANGYVNHAHAEDAAAFDITGDIDLRFDGALDDWTPDYNQCLVAKWPSGASAGAYKLVVLTTGILRLSWTDGTPTSFQADSTVAPTVTDGDRLKIRCYMDVDDGGGNRVITFETKTTGDALDETGWTTLGTAVTVAGTTSIRATADPVAIGSESFPGSNQQVQGEIYAAGVKNGIAGTTVANPDFTTVTSGDTTLTDAAGVRWKLRVPSGYKTYDVPLTFDPWDQFAFQLEFTDDWIDYADDIPDYDFTVPFTFSPWANFPLIINFTDDYIDFMTSILDKDFLVPLNFVAWAQFALGIEFKNGMCLERGTFG